MKITVMFKVMSAAWLALLLVACGNDNQEKSAAVTAAQTTLSTAGSSAPAAGETQTSAQQVAAEPGEAADNLHPGQRLHDANCISCHDSRVYIRDNRKVTDFPQLTAQVRRCDANLGTGLFDDELEQVTAFLNETYYHFGK